MQEMIRDRVRQLIEEGMADRVLAWEQGENFYERTPAVFGPDDLDKLKFDAFCGCNLSKYLISESAKDGRVIALIKPCDSYSLNQLCTENRVNRVKVYAIAVGCKGKIDIEKIRARGVKGITSIEEEGDTLKISTIYGEKQLPRREVLLDKCLYCKGKEHKYADEYFGESEETTAYGHFDKVAELEAMSPEERFDFWRSELSKCIRCNACRNVCPACSCVKCVFDNPNTGVQNKAAADDFEENMFHIIRAFHVAGRCTDCGECSRVCPQGIPLHLLNRKFIKDINEIYGDYQAGEVMGQRHPLISFDKGDAEPSVVHERGGAQG
ncbi:MAG: 4Fe-4S dicluster domain-containing protein [Clostridia bacterium]|nr:4Fe-4S dicluster domain-containing protein [Clostridia bacterium]